jgi:hypothetical protein
MSRSAWPGEPTADLVIIRFITRLLSVPVATVPTVIDTGSAPPLPAAVPARVPAAPEPVVGVADELVTHAYHPGGGQHRRLERQHRIGAPATSTVTYEAFGGPGNDASALNTPHSIEHGDAGNGSLANTSFQFRPPSTTPAPAPTGAPAAPPATSWSAARRSLTGAGGRHDAFPQRQARGRTEGRHRRGDPVHDPAVE